MASKTDFIIVPGAWHGPEAFEPTSALLEKAGYTIHGVSLPCFGASPPLKNFDPDVQVIRDTVNKVLSSGKDAVLIYHSYGSVPGSEALSEYVKKLESGNQKEGWGKIRRLVFCSAFVLPEEGSLMAALQFKDLPWFIVNVRSPDPLFHRMNAFLLTSSELGR
jgi:pimeloyl-ACP methyl ester carboxylesterase